MFRSPFDEPCENPKMQIVAMDVGEGYQAMVSLPAWVKKSEFQRKYEKVVELHYEKHGQNWKYADVVAQTVKGFGGKVISGSDHEIWLIYDP